MKFNLLKTIKKPASKEKKSNNSRKVGHMFQFIVWKTSLDVRYILNGIVAFIIAIALQYLSVEMIYYSNKANSIDDDIQTVSEDSSLTNAEKDDQMNELLDSLASATNEYYKYINILVFINILTIAYLFQNFQEKFFAQLRGIYVPLFTSSLLINAFSTILVCYFVIKYYAEYSTNLGDVEEQRKVKTIIDRISNDKYMKINLLIALLTGIQFTRIIFALQISRIFGPMIKIIGRMLLDLLIFMFLYGLIFIIFACCQELMFNELDEFNDFVITLTTTFSQGMGNFDYDIYDSLKDFPPEFGYGFLTIWITVSLIMLLNFLIAILSTTYSYLNERQNALYLKEVIKLRQRYDYDKLYSNMISAFTPFNIIPILTNSLTIIFRSKIFNHIMLVIEYLPFGVISCLIHLSVNMLLIPFSYLVILVQKLKYIFKTPNQGSSDLFLRTMDAILFMFFGIFILFITCFVDMVKYALSLFDTDIKLLHENNSEKIMMYNALKDGSVDYEHFCHQYRIKDPIDPQVLNSLNFDTIVMNPVKEGLSETTLKILKITVLMIRERHLALFKKKKIGSVFLPVNIVISEVCRNLCIQEHINHLLLGMSYQKSTEFFKSESFTEIINHFTSYNEFELKSKGQSSNYNMTRSMKRKVQQFNLFNKDKLSISKLFWRHKLQQFILKSDEKWMLDQYNIAKKFLVGNSIESNIMDFSEPIYNNYEFILKMKAKAIKNKEIIKSSSVSMKGKIDLDLKNLYNVYTKDVTMNEIQKEFHIQFIAPQEQSNKDLDFLKIDINALVDTITEIEDSFIMRKILKNEKLESIKTVNSWEEDHSNKEYIK